MTSCIKDKLNVSVYFEENGYIELEYNPKNYNCIINIEFHGDGPYLYTEWNGDYVNYDFNSGWTTSSDRQLNEDEVYFFSKYMNDFVLKQEIDKWMINETIQKIPSFLEENNLDLYYDNSSDFANVGTYYLVKKGTDVPDCFYRDTDYTRLAWLLTDTYENETGMKPCISVSIYKN